MHLSPLVAFIAWIPVGLYLFRRYPARIAILANFLGGWAVLPGASYTPTTDPFPYWILGVCLPANYLVTKATVTGLTGLAGVLIFRFAVVRRFRPGFCDIPMVVWCCVPLLSAAARGNSLSQGISDAIYLTISWCVPWLLGRAFFSDYDSLLLAAKACVIAGACYVPICLAELIAGPQLYSLIYGFQPYRWVGAERYIGFRPIGMMEDGNQLGIWMAVATLLAISLSVHGLAKRILGMPAKWVAAGLACMTLLCQSAGSILLLALLLPLALVKGRSILRWAVAVLVLGIVVFALLRMTNVVSLRALAQQNRTIHSIATKLTEMGRHSLVWRLARDEGQVRAALQHPFLGSGQWNWWRNGDERPWSLWLLVLGMYGFVGLIAFGSILLFPIIRAAWLIEANYVPSKQNLRLALAALILIVAIDNLLNGAMILPYLVIMGGLATPGAIRDG